MNYTLHQLLIFLKVAEKQSITKAAEELHLTQPAVSIQLKNFQNQFDIPLIETRGRNIVVTDFGREIEESSLKIMEEVGRIKDKTMAYHGLLAGKLSISLVSTAKYVMPHFLPEFLETHPAIDLTMDVTNRGKVLENLEKNEVDFAMVSVLPTNIQVEKVELMKNKLHLVGNFQNKKIKDTCSYTELENLPLIYREKGSATRQAMELFIKQNGLKIKKTLELTSNEAVKQAVVAGLGFSIMPLIGIKHELTAGDLRIVKLKGLPIVTDWNLVWRKDKPFSPVAKAFLDYLKANKDHLIKSKFAWYENQATSH